MFERIRYKAAMGLAMKAKESIDKGDFKSMMKGIQYFKMSISIIPRENLGEISKRLNTVAKELETELELMENEEN